MPIINVFSSELGRKTLREIECDLIEERPAYCRTFLILSEPCAFDRVGYRHPADQMHI
jgi:hypothetical protein